MIRSVFFSSYTGFGGGETSLYSLLTALISRGHHPALICPRPGPLPEKLARAGAETYFTPYRGASTWFVPALWQRFPVVRHIETRLRQLEPQVVHSDYHSLPYVLPVCRKFKLPLIFTLYGWWFQPKFWQRRFFQDGPNAILAISHAVKKGFVGSPARIDPDRVDVVHLGVDPTRFRPRPHEKDAIRKELGLPLQAPLVTMIARFQNVKGHDVFLNACRLIAQDHPKTRFVIAGENVFDVSADEDFKRLVLAHANSDPALRERVSFAGWVSQPEELLGASDVLVSSSHFESFGMVQIEAMACGVPVVSTEVGGPAETIVDGVTGYLVPPRRPDLIAGRVRELLDSDRLRDRMGLAGRQRVVEKFSLDKYVESFSRVIEALVGEQDDGHQ